MIKIAINGCGRIGRNVLRQLKAFPNLQVCAINDLTDIQTIVHLLKYDSIHGICRDVSMVDNQTIQLFGHNIQYLQEKNPENLPWKALNIDIVIDSTGFFKTHSQLSLHIKAGAKRVILSAPSDDDLIPMLVLGVNDTQVLQQNPLIVSNSSCTTYSTAPVIHMLDEAFGVDSVHINTIHAYTSDQNLHDAPHKDLRRARAAALSIIPTTTGAAKVMDAIFPHLKGKMGGCGIRVPVPTGSLSDIAFTFKKPTTREAINTVLKTQSQTATWEHMFHFTEEPLVSADIIGDTHSCIVDAGLTHANQGLIKVVAWYDNETGYSCRLLNLVETMML